MGDAVEDNISDISDEGTEITPQKVLENIEIAWQNEKFAPEILPPQEDMLELMLSQLEHMEENLKGLDKNDILFTVHKMELERIRYVLASYFRCRLKKIEKYTKAILLEEEERLESNKRLTKAERTFAMDYSKHIEDYFQQVALQYMPNLQRPDGNQQIVRPNLMSHVFIKANESVPGVVVGVDDDEVDLTPGSQHIIPYKLVSDLILKGSIQLT